MSAPCPIDWFPMQLAPYPPCCLLLPLTPLNRFAVCFGLRGSVCRAAGPAAAPAAMAHRQRVGAAAAGAARRSAGGAAPLQQAAASRPRFPGGAGAPAPLLGMKPPQCTPNTTPRPPPSAQPCPKPAPRPAARADPARRPCTTHQPSPRRPGASCGAPLPARPRGCARGHLSPPSHPQGRAFTRTAHAAAPVCSVSGRRRAGVRPSPPRSTPLYSLLFWPCAQSTAPAALARRPPIPPHVARGAPAAPHGRRAAGDPREFVNLRSGFRSRAVVSSEGAGEEEAGGAVSAAPAAASVGDACARQGGPAEARGMPEAFGPEEPPRAATGVGGREPGGCAARQAFDGVPPLSANGNQGE
ncbi:MAG: hypothetical protein J3K34DRAFT_421604 [Monoraphidium minutum]|nr:MAG: hypothetical protein J3K34DRAFT_421604 [Monoraphidium minutum]